MLQYLIVTDDSPESGVLKKARYQVDALNALGMQAELVILTQEIRSREETGPVRYVYFDKLRNPSFFSRFLRAQKIRALISEIITSLGQTDILYYRAFGSVMLSYLPRTFFRPFRQCRVVSEHNSIEWRELLLEGSYRAVIQNIVLGNLIIGQSDGIIGVTEEISRHWQRRLFYRNIPCATIPNGFFVSAVPVRKLPSCTKGELHVLFVGNISRWHGLDRFIGGMAAYRGDVGVNVHIVGDGDERESLEALAHTLGVTGSVHFHGFLSGADLDTVFDRCHIAIGSLGIHRNGMKEASALKVREYCARGIPFMISNNDPDFPATFPYCLSLPPNDAPISMDTVIGFYHRVFARQSHQAEMRAYAEDHLDWPVKMLSLKQFIRTFV